MKWRHAVSSIANVAPVEGTYYLSRPSKSPVFDRSSVILVAVFAAWINKALIYKNLYKILRVVTLIAIVHMVRYLLRQFAIFNGVNLQTRGFQRTEKRVLMAAFELEKRFCRQNYGDQNSFFNRE
ncbi:hypothetical protein ACQR3P_20800 [Rhodococcus sp. IEGM1300]